MISLLALTIAVVLTFIYMSIYVRYQNLRCWGIQPHKADYLKRYIVIYLPVLIVVSLIIYVTFLP